MKSPNASSISRKLHKAGFRLAYDYNHEGMRVRRGMRLVANQPVTVIAQFDSDATANRTAAEARESLTSAGYACSDLKANIFQVLPH